MALCSGLAEITEDIDRQPHGPRPDIGADERPAGSPVLMGS